MKILITGGGGFIGSNIARALLKKNHEIRILDNFATGRKENIKDLRKDIQVIEGDLRNPATVEKAVRGCNYILHQGALPSVPRSIENPLETQEVNVNGTLNILLAAR